MKKIIISIFCFSLFLFFQDAYSIGYHGDYEIIRITNNSWADEVVRIDNDWLAWKAKGQYLYLYNYEYGLSRQFPWCHFHQLNDGFLIFNDTNYDGPFLYNTSQDLLIKISDDAHMPNYSCDEEISYPWVVFTKRLTDNWEVYLYNIEEKSLQMISNNYWYRYAPSPITDGTYVVWVGDSSLFVYNIKSKELVEAISEGCSWGPSISKGKVILRRGDNLILYDCESGRITTVAGNWKYTWESYDISNNYVVWFMHDAINLYKVSDGSSFKIGNGFYPRIVYPYIVWEDIESLYGPDIFKVYNITSKKISTINTDVETWSRPEITEEGIVAWYSYYPNNRYASEIYIAIPEYIEATFDIDPDTLNRKSEGKWVTAYIELPEGYNVDQIDVYSVAIVAVDDVDVDTPIYAELSPTEIGDYDNDGILDFMIKFNREDLIQYLNTGDRNIVASGNLNEGTKFKGSDIIRVIN